VEDRILQLRLSQVTADPGLQPRTECPMETIEKYARQAEDGVQLRGKRGDEYPVVFHDPSDTFWLADGFLRFEAYGMAGKRTEWFRVHEGTRRDALLYAVGCNDAHGLPRGNADKHRAVQLLLEDPEMADWPNRKIGRYCAVSEFLVRTVREEMAEAAILSQAAGDGPIAGKVPMPLDIARGKAMRRLTSLVKLLGQYQELAEARELLGAVQRLLDGGNQAA